MGGNRLQLDLDLGKLMGLATQAPELIAALEDGGIPVPPQVMGILRFVGPLAQMASKVTSARSTLDHPQLPDTGPLGEGRKLYGFNRERWTDRDVATATRYTLKTEGVIDGIGHIKRALNFYLDIACPGSSLDGSIQPSDGDLRKAVDKLLGSDLLPVRDNEKFGDMLMFALKAGQRQNGEGK